MVTLKVKYLRTFMQASVGLLPAVKAYPVFFKTRFGIHTFFMGFPIDVLILNKTNRVVLLKKNLLPFRILIWNPLYNTVIELPQGTIDSQSIKINDVVKLEIER